MIRFKITTHYANNDKLADTNALPWLLDRMYLQLDIKHMESEEQLFYKKHLQNANNFNSKIFSN